jgi:hypothetical protein
MKTITILVSVIVILFLVSGCSQKQDGDTSPITSSPHSPADLTSKQGQVNEKMNEGTSNTTGPISDTASPRKPDSIVGTWSMTNDTKSGGTDLSCEITQIDDKTFKFTATPLVKYEGGKPTGEYSFPYKLIKKVGPQTYKGEYSNPNPGSIIIEYDRDILHGTTSGAFTGKHTWTAHRIK